MVVRTGRDHRFLGVFEHTMNKRLGREDWLDLGLQQLTRKGAAGLTVEALCDAAQRTRGSLYHHFSDHGAFLDALMMHWQKRYTQDIADQSSAEPSRQKRKKLSDLALAIDPILETAVRKFAPSHPGAQDIVAAVDESRVAFVTALYEEAGMAPDLAAQIGKIEYAAYIGVQMIWPQMEGQERKALDRRFGWLLIQSGLIRDEGL